ncbi:MAG: alpha/beta hydrolase [Acholeplasmataceae bacterium]|nr:alpha/beta hydrolase [Acholeplasmataceae bacterium]
MKINVNRITLNHEIIGHGKPLILLHGNQENYHIFDMIKDELSKKYEVHLIDSRNHGDSEKTEDFTFKTMTEDIASYIEKLNLGSVYFYGYSDGGIIGFMLSYMYPQMVKKLMVSGVNVHPSGLKKNLMKEIIETYEKNKSPYLKMMMDQPNIQDKDLNKIQIPVLLTLGEYDLITRSHTKSIISNLKYGALKIYPGLDHGSHLNNHRTFINDLLNFFD